MPNSSCGNGINFRMEYGKETGKAHPGVCRKCGREGAEKFEKAARSAGVAFRESVGADSLTTFGGGGTVFRLYEPRDKSELCSLMRAAADVGMQENVFFLGGGSDTVIADGTVYTPVVSTHRLNRIAMQADGTVYAECGVRISALIVSAAKHGRGGFEFLWGVPATVGGALRLNAGAFGAQTADYVIKIERLNADCAETEWVDATEAEFGYRRGAEGFLLSAVFGLSPATPGESRALAVRYAAERRKKQPALPSCGSVFAGADMPAGYYIERAGLKGVRRGGAQISELHANFIVNTGGATATDFTELVNLAERRVRELFGVNLRREFVLLE